MKKILCLLFMVLLFGISVISASADALQYQPNIFTDETSIEEDFKNLNIDINDYYKPTKFKNYQKWYVIGMSESYVDTEKFDIQTYFYLYNPSEYGTTNNYMSTVASLYLTYMIDGHEVENASALKLDYNKEHLIYKVKGFTYSFSERSEIYISKIKHYNFYGSGITSDSSFKAVANHSKLNGFQVELSFDSTIIIEDYGVDVVEIVSESMWKNSFGTLPILLSKSFQRGHAYFYNFNFPKKIKPDSIEYAKFVYNKTQYHQYTNGTVETIKESLGEIHEYTPGTKTIQIDSQSCELEFQTFVLGNRVKKGEFGYLEFTKEDEKKYDVDCSILLEVFLDQYTNHKVYESLPGMIGGGMWVTKTEKWYSELDQVEMLELHYKKDGILYKCQVVNQPLDKEDFTQSRPEPPLSEWEKFLKWFKENFPLSAFLVVGLPIIAIVVAIFCPQVAILAFNGLIAVIGYVIKGIIGIFKIILNILTFPFRLIIGLFKKRE